MNRSSGETIDLEGGWAGLGWDALDWFVGSWVRGFVGRSRVRVGELEVPLGLGDGRKYGRNTGGEPRPPLLMIVMNSSVSSTEEVSDPLC